MKSIKVLIVDDQRLIRDGIASLLDLQEDIQVIGTAINGIEAIQLTEKLTPDIILMDVRMPEMNGIEATAHIHDKFPDCRVLMLTTFDDDDYIVKSLVAGANGYLLKDMPPDDLAQAVRLTFAGIFQLSPAVAGKLVGQLSSNESQKITARQKSEIDLTEREFEVLGLIATGATNKEIAQELVISEGTVKNHVSNILSRLGLRDRVQAALFAYEHGLIQPQDPVRKTTADRK